MSVLYLSCKWIKTHYHIVKCIYLLTVKWVQLDFFFFNFNVLSTGILFVHPRKKRVTELCSGANCLLEFNYFFLESSSIFKLTSVNTNGLKKLFRNFCSSKIVRFVEMNNVFGFLEDLYKFWTSCSSIWYKELYYKQGAPSVLLK